MTLYVSRKLQCYIVNQALHKFTKLTASIQCSIDMHNSPASRFFSSCACSWGGREWKDLGLSPGFSGGKVSLSSCSLIVWYSLRLAGTVSKCRKYPTWEYMVHVHVARLHCTHKFCVPPELISKIRKILKARSLPPGSPSFPVPVLIPFFPSYLYICRPDV